VRASIIPIRTGKTYTVTQAARRAGTTPQNVRRWLLGYEAPGHRMKPVFGRRPRDEGAPALSFLELAELIVVARFRQRSGRRISLDRLRAAHAFARERLQIPYPFASGRLKAEGGHIMHEFEEGHPGQGKIAIDVGGLYALPIDFSDTLDLFDFDEMDGLAVRFYPHGRETPVIVDPDHASGSPSIVGSNVRVEIIIGRWKAGESIAELEDDFEIPASTIEAVLRAA